MLTTIYPEAGEAVVCQVFPRPEAIEGADPPPVAEADEAASWERANRRAKGRSRRYIVANRLRFMWVLTFAGEGLHGPEGRRECMAAVAVLCRRLRAENGPLPYWFSPELHPGGHGWHCNLFLPRRIKHAHLEERWSHGHVWAKDWTRDSRVKGETFLVKLRAGAGYGAKYASKDWSKEQLAHGAHRYERAEGFDPKAVLAEVRSVPEGVRLALDHLEGHGSVWWSFDAEDWTGPACATVTMSGAPPRLRRRNVASATSGLPAT